MKLSHFNFELPDELLAEYPSENRDESRLMVLNREKQTIEHKQFKDLIDYFNEDDVMILNDTKVFPARLFGNKEKTGARIEVFLLRELNAEQRLWDVLVDPARKIRIGNKLYSHSRKKELAKVEIQILCMGIQDDCFQSGQLSLLSQQENQLKYPQLHDKFLGFDNYELK